MPNPRQEQWCLERLKSAILAQHPGAHLRDELGCEPPDFWLDVNGRRFAVEVSTIRVEHEKTCWESLCKLVKQIESTAILAGTLSGRYHIRASAELPRPRKARKALEAAIREYVCETRTANSSPERELWVDGMLFGHIRKYAAENAKLHLMGGLTNTGASEHEIRDELQRLLNERISRKRKKLADCEHPTILVLYDCYWLEDEMAGFVERIKESPDTSFFHAVFLIHNNKDEVFAHQSCPLVG
ncbi:MAG: hypothetical protein KAV82_09100 [Phycisphaerae bacterium]|nr:hypothetical protein [Phycisphaerae bacterium]